MAYLKEMGRDNRWRGLVVAALLVAGMSAQAEAKILPPTRLKLARAEAPHFIHLHTSRPAAYNLESNPFQASPKTFMAIDKKRFPTRHRKVATLTPQGRQEEKALPNLRALDSELEQTPSSFQQKQKDVIQPQTDTKKAKEQREDASLRTRAQQANIAREHVGKVSFNWPIAKEDAQYISSNYGMRKDPFTGQEAFHGGVDIAARQGTDVLAMASGEVVDAGEKGRLGNHIALLHADGSESLYGHLSKESVTIGSYVRRGQKIGEVGSTGRSTGPHLDVRVRKDGKTLHPFLQMRVSSAPKKLQKQLYEARSKARELFVSSIQ